MSSFSDSEGRLNGADAVEQLRALLAISREIHGDAPAGRAFSRITAEAARFLHADRAALFWVNPESNRLVSQASLGLSAAYLAAVDHYYEQSAGGLAGRLMLPIIVTEVAADPRVSAPLKAAAIAEGFVSQLMLPLKHVGSFVGGLVLYWNHQTTVDAQRLALAQLFADQATTAMINHYAIEEARRRTDVAERLASQRMAALEESSRSLHQALEAAMKAERAKGEFVSMVSHELRTPLAVILGTGELLEDGVGGELNGQQAELVGNIMHATAQLTALVDDLLDLSRIEAGSFRLEAIDVAIEPVLAESVRSLQTSADDRQVTLVAEVPKLPIVRADPNRLRQICVNLLSNAIKFTQPGGRVTLVAARETNGIRVTVSDTGIGLTEEQRSQLFQKFYRVDNALTRQTPGTGLGLAISKQLVDAMGGQIGVTSEPGRGSAFWFTLPAAR